MGIMGNVELQISRELGNALEKGLRVSEETLFFAESTYGIAGESLASAVQDVSFEGREALSELIFTPEPDVRFQVEPVLECTGLPVSAVSRLSETLAGRFPRVELIVPDSSSGNSKRFSIYTGKSSSDVIHLFVKKLYLDRSLDSPTVAALEQTFKGATVTASRVMMRCRGDVFGERKRAFLSRLIIGSAAYENRFEALLNCALILLAEIEDREPAEQHFLKKKKMLINKLKEISLFIGKRDHYSMEYLMMQRAKIPHESEEEVRNQLFLLATITDVILGLPPDPGLQIESKDLGSFDTQEGIDALIRNLS